MNNLAIKYSILEDGTILDMSRASLFHNITLSRIEKEIQKILTDSCQIFREQSYRWKEHIAPYRMPDLSIICENEKSSNNVDLENIPRFIIEILSDSTEKEDRTIKMDIYGLIGVKEYWLIDPIEKKIERYINNSNKMELIDIINADSQKRINFLTNEEQYINIENIWYKN